MKPNSESPLINSVTVGAVLMAACSTGVIGQTGAATATCEISISPQGINLQVQNAGDGLNHWRIDSSTNLFQWSRAGSIEVLSGQGTALVAFPSGLPPANGFFRAVLDNSAANVLNLPAQYYNYANIQLPRHLNSPQERATDNTPATNVVTDAGATLGRVLFYDKKLSRNYSVACASCHQQEHGFSDPLAFSKGFEGGLTGRNSMGLSNAKFYQRGHFFWDERANTLEDQTLMPIQNAVEMGMTLPELVTRVQSYDYYRQLFTAAYGDATVTSERISMALAQFVRSMLSYRSKYDEGVPFGFANFTAEEELGRQIFNGNRGNCSACHIGMNFAGDRVENNGLEFPYVDLGVGGITGSPEDNGKFKMSSLRNIEKTAPYMHDGRFTTLEQVIDHYSTGVVMNPNLGRPLTQGGNGPQAPLPRRPNFTAVEKAALVAFLKTLTDNSFLTDPKYATPFK